MSLILAIDPGNFESGYVMVDRESLRPVAWGLADNEELIEIFKASSEEDMEIVIEMIGSYGMAVGKTTFDTVVYIGRLYNLFKEKGFDPILITRFNIKMTLCKDPRAKDKNITQAVKDFYPATGGGADPWKGTKKQPGPLYGFKSHIFSALAVALGYLKGAERYEINAIKKI
jgi:hypothetical protein